MFSLAMLTALRAGGEAVLAFLEKVPLWVYLVVAALSYGAWQHHRIEAQQAAAQAAAIAQANANTQASEAARARETTLNAKNQEISDALTVANTQRDAAARTAAQRLRDLASAKQLSAATAAAAATCRSLAAPAAAVIPGQTLAGLVDLARDADAVSDQLKACQAYVQKVVQPGEPVAKP